MIRFAALILATLALSACNVRRDVPDETKVQSHPAWTPAPSNNLPTPQ